MEAKRKYVSEHLRDLDEVFLILREHKLCLNASKCSFGVASRKFLGYMITHCGIKVNPDQIRAIHDLYPPRNPKEVQRLTKMTAALNIFISQSADGCRPFFQLLHKWKDFAWSMECDKALEEQKRYLAHPPILSRLEKENVLYTYIAIMAHVVWIALVRTNARV